MRGDRLERGAFDAGGGRAAQQDAAHRVRVQARRLDAAPAVHRAEYRPESAIGGLQPSLDGAHRAGGAVLAARDAEGGPELTKRPNFTYRVKIDISASAEKPWVANFRTTGQTDGVYRTVFKVSLRLRRHRSERLSGIMCF